MAAWRQLIAAADDAETLLILSAGMLAEGVLNQGNLAELAKDRAEWLASEEHERSAA